MMHKHLRAYVERDPEVEHGWRWWIADQPAAFAVEGFEHGHTWTRRKARRRARRVLKATRARVDAARNPHREMIR